MAIEEPVVTLSPPIVNWEDCIDDKTNPPPIEVINQDGIVKPKIRFIDSFDNGRLQSILVPTGFLPNNTGRYFLTEGQWDYFATGGRQNGGYIRSIANTNVDGGQYNSFPRETPTVGNGMVGDPTPDRGGIFTGICLFGQTLPVGGIAVHGYHSDITGNPHLTVNINQDRTISAIAFGTPNVILQTSIITVPENGWLGLESQIILNPLGNLIGGLILVKLYTLTNPAGDYVITQKGVKTRNGGNNIFADAYGTQAWKGTGAGEGVSLIGFDDIILYNGAGSVKKFLADSYVASIIANDVGSNSESKIDFIDAFGNHPVHGDPVRWKNVVQIDPHREPSTASGVGFVGRGINGDDSAVLTFDQSPSTGAWLNTVPFYINPTTYNHFETEAIDTYKLSSPRSDVVDILAVSPFVFIGSCWTTWSNGFGGTGVLSGLHGVGDNVNRVYHPVIKRGSTLWSGKVSIAHESTFKPQMGYGIHERDVLETDPSTSIAWLPSALAPGSIESGVKGDNSFSGSSLFGVWNEFDLQQIGLEYVYHKAIVIQETVPPSIPIANFIESGTGLGPYSFVDTSIDWDGTIVSWHWDFGDGNISTLQNPPDHTYLATGDKIVTLTVTDNDGLTNTHSVTLAIPNNPPVANFSFAANPGDVTNKTVDFTDLSTDLGGTIVAWDWDFGDGTLPHSTVQNPTHAYAAPGTPLVTLLVTDNNGATNSATAEVDIPIGGGGGDCTLSNDALTDKAYVQGDDYAGGNPPLPSYINTAAFDSWYEGTGTFREAYDNPYAAAGVDHRIDTVNTFNGHSTLQMDFGAGHFGAGWDTIPTDDGSPVETYYSTGTDFGPKRVWTRIIFNADAGVMSDVAATVPGTGLLILDLSGRNVDVSIYNRQGLIKVEINSRTSFNGSLISNIFDVCNENVFVGRGDAFFGELIVLAECDEVANTLHTRIWAGQACMLTGVSPLVNQTASAFGSSGFPVNARVQFDFSFAHFNWFFTPSGAIKHLNVGLWEQEDPDKTSSANPYGVSLT